MKPDIAVMVGSNRFHRICTIAAVPDRQGPALGCNLLQRGTGVRSSNHVFEGDEAMSSSMHGHLVNQDFAFPNELKIDHSIICSIVTVRSDADLYRPLRAAAAVAAPVL